MQIIIMTDFKSCIQAHVKCYLAICKELYTYFAHDSTGGQVTFHLKKGVKLISSCTDRIFTTYIVILDRVRVSKDAYSIRELVSNTIIALLYVGHSVINITSAYSSVQLNSTEIFSLLCQLQGIKLNAYTSYKFNTYINAIFLERRKVYKSTIIQLHNTNNEHVGDLTFDGGYTARFMADGIIRPVLYSNLYNFCKTVTKYYNIKYILLTAYTYKNRKVKDEIIPIDASYAFNIALNSVVSSEYVYSCGLYLLTTILFAISGDNVMYGYEPEIFYKLLMKIF